MAKKKHTKVVSPPATAPPVAAVPLLTKKKPALRKLPAPLSSPPSTPSLLAASSPASMSGVIAPLPLAPDRDSPVVEAANLSPPPPIATAPSTITPPPLPDPSSGQPLRAGSSPTATPLPPSTVTRSQPLDAQHGPSFGPTTGPTSLSANGLLNGLAKSDVRKSSTSPGPSALASSLAWMLDDFPPLSRSAPPSPPSDVVPSQQLSL